MSISALKPSRVRLLALLLVAMFSFAAIGATTIASATDATASKKKKCKKGYKKVGKKCKKIKKKQSAANPGTVTEVKLYLGEAAGQSVKVYGEVLTKSGFTGSKVISFTAVTAAGTQTTSGKATSVGGRTEVNFTADVAFVGAAPVQITAQVDDKVSNTLTVGNLAPSN